MRLTADAARAVVVALVAAGFALTVWVFYPGVMTFDSRYVYQYGLQSRYGDWQSPVMSLLWGWIDPLAPGAGSMFLLITLLYWLAFAVLAWRLAAQSVVRAVVLLLLAVSPPAFMLVGMLWRDVLLACVWLLAAALALAAAEAGAKLRVPAQAIAIGLLTLGVLLRPNAIVAAPILLTFLLWPGDFAWRRAAIVFVPAAAAFFVLVQIVYYGVLGAERQHPMHSLFVFDLGGISHFTKQNRFPGTWSSSEAAMIVGRCYRPDAWDYYWTRKPCDFVMSRLEDAKLFGSPAMAAAWRRAVIDHPLAYLRHRAAFNRAFLTGANLTMWTWDLDDLSKPVFPGRSSFLALQAVNDALAATPLLRAGTWLLLCVVVVIAAWRRRGTPAGAFAIGVCGSAVAYLMTFAPLGVASDFRYAYWPVLAGLAGAVVIWPANRPS
jgi:hypothetical protein